jgi:hypothetical protein
MPDRSPIELKQIRLRNDYATMENIRRPWLSWKVIAGTVPFVEQYEIALRLRAIIGPKPEYREDHIVQAILGPDYPISQPTVKMLTRPLPFHPTWWPSGLWCSGDWFTHESLGAHIVRMIQTLQYDPEITQGTHRANGQAADWYNANRTRSWFPCDRTPLPDPTGGPAPNKLQKKKFEVKARKSEADTRQDNRIVVACTNPECGQKLRLPAGKSGLIKCPKCGLLFSAQT